MSQIYTRSGEPVTGDLIAVFPKVEGLFAKIARFLSEEHGYVSVDYDPVLGHPVRMDVGTVQYTDGVSYYDIDNFQPR